MDCRVFFLITNIKCYLNVNTNIPYQQILTCRAINPQVFLHFTPPNLNSYNLCVVQWTGHQFGKASHYSKISVTFQVSSTSESHVMQTTLIRKHCRGDVSVVLGGAL